MLDAFRWSSRGGQCYFEPGRPLLSLSPPGGARTAQAMFEPHASRGQLMVERQPGRLDPASPG